MLGFKRDDWFGNVMVGILYFLIGLLILITIGVIGMIISIQMPILDCEEVGRICFEAKH